MPLDPQVLPLLALRAAQPPLETQSVEEARRNALVRPLAQSLAPLPIAGAVDRTIPGPEGRPLPVRVYTPRGAGPFPLMTFFHGSGFVICNLDTHDAMCRNLCAAGGCVVVSVDYRLAPDYKFPAAPEDCYAATCWTARQARELNGDAQRLIVAGDSAGGNLAAVTALRARDRDGPALRGQLLLYPVISYHTPPTASYIENAEGYGLTAAGMKWYWNHYLASPADAENPYACPMRADDLLGLPPALIMTAEYDVLRDEGEQYGQALRAAGVPAQITRYDGYHHGFFGCVGVLDRAQLALDEAAAWLNFRLA